MNKIRKAFRRMGKKSRYPNVEAWEPEQDDALYSEAIEYVNPELVSSDLEIYEPPVSITLSDASGSNIQTRISTILTLRGKSSVPKRSSKLEHEPYSQVRPRSHDLYCYHQNRSVELPAASSNEKTSLKQDNIERQTPRLEGLTLRIVGTATTSVRVFSSKIMENCISKSS